MNTYRKTTEEEAETIKNFFEKEDIKKFKKAIKSLNQLGFVCDINKDETIITCEKSTKSNYTDK